jgi:hypothetical protein
MYEYIVTYHELDNIIIPPKSDDSEKGHWEWVDTKIVMENSQTFPSKAEARSLVFVTWRRKNGKDLTPQQPLAMIHRKKASLK